MEHGQEKIPSKIHSSFFLVTGDPEGTRNLYEQKVETTTSFGLLKNLKSIFAPFQYVPKKDVTTIILEHSLVKTEPRRKNQSLPDTPIYVLSRRMGRINS